MPPPTRQFHRLSIGQMPARDSRSVRAGRADPSEDRAQDDSSQESSGEGEGSEESSGEEEEEEEDDDDEEDDVDESASAETSTVLAQSGITYDLSNLDTESEAQALVGLGEQFDVINCRASSTGYDFQLLDRPRVHIGKNANTCTCTSFQERPEAACQHIFWVLDQLHGCFLPNPPSNEVILSSNGRPQQGTPIEDLLEGNLEAVTSRLNWQCLRVEGDNHCTGMTRAEKVRDVLSAFKPNILPEGYRQDLTDSTATATTQHSSTSLTPEQCVVQGDFEATIFRLAVHDDSVFDNLCKAMPAGACAAIYFDKIQDQARRLLRDFDLYCATSGQRGAAASSILVNEAGGPTTTTSTSSPGGLGVQVVEVDEVVAQLRLLVQHISVNIALRSPHGSEGAAKALVSILEAVAARNRDPLEGNKWGRTSFHGEDEDQRNLYHLLIGSEDSDVDSEEFFVLETLERLAPFDLGQFINQLQSIRLRLEVNRAPKVFLLRLGALVRKAESASAETAAGQKRPAVGSSGGNSKRTR